MNRKLLLSCACLVLLLSACTSYTAMYSIPLTGVTPPKQNQLEPVKIEPFTDAGITKYRFEDADIQIVMYVLPKRIIFDLKNKTDQTAKLIWDDAVMVDYTGANQRVTHVGVRFMDRDNPKPPTSILAGTLLHEEVTPTSNIYLDRLEWKVSGLFPVFYKTKSEPEAKQYEGKTMKLLLPIELRGEKKEYIFDFLVEKFTGFQTVNYLP